LYWYWKPRIKFKDEGWTLPPIIHSKSAKGWKLLWFVERIFLILKKEKKAIDGPWFIVQWCQASSLDLICWWRVDQYNDRKCIYLLLVFGQDLPDVWFQITNNGTHLISGIILTLARILQTLTKLINQCTN
jgi:hypothetical protein